MTITVDYLQTNRKTDTGKTLKPWPVLVDHYTRRPHGDELVYISLACSCEWEQEHGLQIVFKQGLYINKVGPYNGHLTNSDAYGNDKLENVIYC